MKEHFNQLTPAEAERLALLAEECGEVMQAAAQFVETEHFPIGWSVDRIREVIAKVSDMTPNAEVSCAGTASAGLSG